MYPPAFIIVVMSEPLGSTSPDSRARAEEHYLEAIDKLAANRPEEALVSFQHALDQDPSMLEALHGLIRALRECGHLDEAIEAAKRLVLLEPDEALPHTSLSILYQQKGMIVEAEDEATKARLLDWKRQLRGGSEPDSVL
jgi:Flp pilus assembly protein TadD